MKVTDTSSFVSSALVGNMQVAEMTVDNSPEFFEILSSSIYNKSPILAFVRETISNGWDAHKEAGIDSPLEITLTEEEVSFVDYGSGIPTDLDTFQQIYGNYGKGTKRNNVNAIGGFGLGCKSPLAYAKSFYVTSAHNGIQANYCITKGTLETDGKFAIIKTFENKTPVTGVAVIVPIKQEDKTTIENYIKAFVCISDIPVKLNGVLLPTIKMPFEEASFTIIHSQSLPTLSFMNVRVANVVYPFPENTEDEEYNKLFTVVQKFFYYEVNTTTRDVVIIQAAPEQVTIHPSRESLVASKHTLNYLKTLLHKMVKEFKRQANIIQDCLTKVVKKKINSFTKKDLVYTQYDVYPELVKELSLMNYISTRNLYFCLLKHSINNLPRDKKAYLHNIINDKVKQKYKNNLVLFNIKTTSINWAIGFRLAHSDTTSEYPYHIQVTVKEQHVEPFDSKNIYSIFSSFNFANNYMKGYSFNYFKRLALSKVTKPLIVLTANKNSCHDWVIKAKHQLGIPSSTPYVVIFTSSKKENIKWLQDHIESLDFMFIDLTKDWDFKPQKRKVISTSKDSNTSSTAEKTLLVRTDKQVYRLKDILDDDFRYFDHARALDAAPITNPKAIVLIPKDYIVCSRSVDAFLTPRVLSILNTLNLLNDVGVVFTTHAYKVWVDKSNKGVDSFDNYICKSLIAITPKYEKEYKEYLQNEVTFNSYDAQYSKCRYVQLLSLCHEFSFNPVGIKPAKTFSEEFMSYKGLLTYVQEYLSHSLAIQDTSKVISSLPSASNSSKEKTFISMIDNTPLTPVILSTPLAILKEACLESYDALAKLYIKQLKKVKI